ncbi:DUF192 domain-containing protein [Algihabitans albus]|uniref:DUF192 domain-containing protein n=1 Tax=Algihabitans albus TaxID=2164067 RepID=UPI0035CEE2AF
MLNRFLLLLVLLAAPAAQAKAETAEIVLPVVPLSILAADGTLHEFRVELARTPEEQAQGLMFRKELAADRGMLFVNRRPRVSNFWMKNTYIPLDMVWIGPDWRILGAHENAVPHSTAAISSNVPVRATLEVPGGTVARLGLARGDRVTVNGLN